MEKRIIQTCIADSLLDRLIKEVEALNEKNSFKIEFISRDEFYKNDLSFVIVDETIFSEIIEKKYLFKQLILIRTSKKRVQDVHKESEIISINIPFRFNDLYKIIANRLDLISSQDARSIKFNSFAYDPRTRLLSNKNSSIRFTEKESYIFEYLLKNHNQYISKKVLLKEIWSYSENIDTHTLETHIYSLRKKVSKNLTLKKLINFEEKKGYFLEKKIL